MDKDAILSKYRRPEDKLLISKFLDKIDIVNKTNKIGVTDFYNESEQAILRNIINIVKLKDYIIFGGTEESERKLIVIYPDKMRELFENNNFKFDTIFSVFRITVPKENKGFFNHSVYLGGIIKLGIRREKIGDIVVYDDGADIIVKKETDKFLYTNLSTLTRFSNASIVNIKLEDIVHIPKKFEDIKIVTSSLRLDNMVAELAKTSRNKAIDILMQERVFVNYVNETKNTKIVKSSDIISIRGKGKFVIEKIEGNTKKGNYIVLVKKYI